MNNAHCTCFSRRRVRSCLSSVSVSLEVKPQLENVIMKLAPKPSFVRVLPFPVHNLEGDVFVRRASREPKDRKVGVVGTGSLK